MNRLSVRSSDNFEPAGAPQKPVQTIQALSPLDGERRRLSIRSVWEKILMIQTLQKKFLNLITLYYINTEGTLVTNRASMTQLKTSFKAQYVVIFEGGFLVFGEKFVRASGRCESAKQHFARADCFRCN